MRYILPLFFLAFALGVKAQSGPGLLGKRVVLHAHWGLGYNISDNYYRSVERDPTFFQKGVVLHHRLDVDYNWMRNRSIGLGWAYYQAGLGNVDPAFSKVLQTQTVSLFYKQFNLLSTGSLAPIGKYVEVRPVLYLSRSGFLGNPAFFETPKLVGEERQVNWGLMMAFSRQKILTNQLMVNIGVDIGIVFPGPKDETVSEAFSQIFNREINTTYPALLMSHLFLFRVGLSYALF